MNNLKKLGLELALGVSLLAASPHVLDNEAYATMPRSIQHSVPHQVVRNSMTMNSHSNTNSTIKTIDEQRKLHNVNIGLMCGLAGFFALGALYVGNEYRKQRKVQGNNYAN